LTFKVVDFSHYAAYSHHPPLGAAASPPFHPPSSPPLSASFHLPCSPKLLPVFQSILLAAFVGTPVFDPSPSACTPQAGPKPCAKPSFLPLFFPFSETSLERACWSLTQLPTSVGVFAVGSRLFSWFSNCKTFLMSASWSSALSFSSSRTCERRVGVDSGESGTISGPRRVRRTGRERYLKRKIAY